MTQNDLAKRIMGKNFIGFEELLLVSENLNISFDIKKIDPKLPIPFEPEYLSKVSDTHVLIMFIPFDKNDKFITLNSFRDFYGINPDIKEPCFYNQDWYINEHFANEPLKIQHWFCIRKEVLSDSRGKTVKDSVSLPLALICVYTFFATYFCNDEYLWKNDFVWCKDLDSNGDRIYVGRYFDKSNKAKNGFSIHRHLSINNQYGSIS